MSIAIRSPEQISDVDEGLYEYALEQFRSAIHFQIMGQY